MDTEYAEVEENDVESITCVCGNTCSDEGMIQANPEGIAVHLSNTPVPAGLAPFPEDEDELHTLCPVCGRVYSDKTIKETNTAPVAFRVDVSDGTTHKDAIVAHWNELN